MTFPPPGYHSKVRTDLAPFLPRGVGLRVLEVGCGEGATGAWLKRSGVAVHVVGIERDEDAAAVASAVLDEVHVGDLETFDLPTSATFDLLLAADVLEHLRDPHATFDRLVRRVRPGGWVLTSTPNVRFWRVLVDLAIRGRWDYGSNVVLDPTHYRFFTRHSIEHLHSSVGLRVERVGHLELSGKRQALDMFTAGMLREFLCGQHVIRSRRPAQHR